MNNTKDGPPPPIPFDLFEVLPDGSVVPLGSVHGVETAWQRLFELAKHTLNECFALHPATRQIVAQVNVSPMVERARKRLFQIAYTEHQGVARSEELNRRGYRVTTVVGNARAMAVLDQNLHCDLFIIGHGADADTRKHMVVWLKKRYPNVRILALNSAHQRLPGADYNVPLDGPERWLSLVAQSVA